MRNVEHYLVNVFGIIRKLRVKNGNKNRNEIELEKTQNLRERLCNINDFFNLCNMIIDLIRYAYEIKTMVSHN